METKNGVFVISLDFELYWGIRDRQTIQGYKQNLDGTRHAIEKILELFDTYEIHATWATVGFLFAKSSEELERASPSRKPHYINTNLNPYNYIKSNNPIETNYHFALESIKKIYTYKNQEIGTHTFSHYYCLENGQTIDEFDSDLATAIKIAKAHNISIESLVFPRNQWNATYLLRLSDHGITSYRGNENGWLYEAVNETNEKLARRALRLMDAYINLSGHNSYDIQSIHTKKPYNIPSSRFLRPVSQTFSLIEGFRKRRIINAMKYAAKKGEVFHLWWHPHNFGVNTDKNIRFLEVILSSFADMKETYGMESLTMGEVSKLITERGA